MTDLATYHGVGTRLAATPVSSAQVDGDVIRARRAGHRRQMRRTGTRTALAGALAVGAFAGAAPTSGHPSHHNATGARRAVGVKLVDFSGAQPQGFTLGRVPQGWSVETSNPYYLTIAADGAAHVDPQELVGKLIVTFGPAEPADTSLFGTPIAVGIGQGFVRHAPDPTGNGTAALLDYQSPSGQWVQVQSPSDLGWSDQQVADFAAGVTVTAEARRGAYAQRADELSRAARAGVGVPKTSPNASSAPAAAGIR